jgi:phenylacetate-CoA ligase
MKDYAQLTYNHAPIFVQNLLVSFYGLKLQNERYGRGADLHYSELLGSEWYGVGQIEDLQNKLFLQIIRHAFNTVPFYRQWQKEAGVDVTCIRSIADVEKLPIISKDQIRKDPSAFCSELYLNKRRAFWLETSGTTGTPLKVLCDWDSRRRHYAFWRRLRSWYGINPGDSRATFFGRIVVPPEQARPPFWRYDRVGKNLIFSSFHLSDENLIHYYQALEKYNPKEVIGYPSSIYLVARYMVRHGKASLRPRCVFTTGETLLPYQREIIEEAFDCRVADQYGCTEMAIFVSQCEKGEYHLHPEHGVVEILEPDQNGEGVAVCTSFVNRAMPLIRYNLRDNLRLAARECECGRFFPVLDYIAGRADDSILLPDGRRIGRFSPFFKGILGLREVQVVQKEDASLDIYAVADEVESQQAIRNSILQNFKNRLGTEVKLKLHFIKSIDKQKNGKFQAAISLIKK